MTDNSNLAVHIAIAPLKSTKEENFAIWVTSAPYSSGYGHNDRVWPSSLTAKWVAWQEMFSLQDKIHLPVVHNEVLEEFTPVGGNYGGQLMQELGVSLWEWVFQGEIAQSFAQSQGMAITQNLPLRLRLDIRDPNLIPLPYEIMQDNRGKQPISLNEKILFSRTTFDVTPLNSLSVSEGLKILLVLGADSEETMTTLPDLRISLQEESDSLNHIIKNTLLSVNTKKTFIEVTTDVDTLTQPTPEELISTLETGNYNILFYAGHGEPGPDGGILFFGEHSTINGTELAQILVRNQVILAVFNACWGAQPYLNEQKTLSRSSLAEVLIHHGVPAVLAMRDAIADEESLAFIKSFTKCLCERMPIDYAVTVARQQLLSIYKFNQPAWTLPILYLHPEFQGELIKPLNEKITELPELTLSSQPEKIVYLRSQQNPNQIWRLRGGLMRVGRSNENDVIIAERWVSQKHAEIICRDFNFNDDNYCLKDFSRFGTLINVDGKWQKVLHQEIPLKSRMQIKFGSINGETLEFIIETN